MAGPGQPVIHDAPHDLESLFYVLVGICVLLDEPFKFKSNDDLSYCFDKYFNTFEPSVLKSIVIQSDLTWSPMIVEHLSPYFKPLLPLLTHLHQDIISPMYTDKDGNFHRAKPLTHRVLIDAIIDTLLSLDDGAWTPYSNPDVGNNYCTSHSGDKESKYRDNRGEDEDEDKDKDKDNEDDQEMMSPADEPPTSSLTQSIISDSESDVHIESHASPATLHHTFHHIFHHTFLKPITRPPYLPRFSSRASGGMGFQSNTFTMEVRRRALEDAPDDYSHPWVKRAQSSSKSAGESSSHLAPQSILKGKSMNTTMLRRSTRTIGKKPE